MVEDEFHFVLYCPLYHNLRSVLFEHVIPDVFWLTEDKIMNWIYNPVIYSWSVLSVRLGTEDKEICTVNELYIS